MNQFQTQLMSALAHLHPDGFDGFDLSRVIPPASYPDYQQALKPENTALTQQEIADAAAAWEAAAPERARQRMAISVPQFRKMLRVTQITIGGQAMTLKAAVETAIGAIENAEEKADMEDWYESPPAQIRRSNGRVEGLRIVLGITPEAADEMWQTAAAYQ
jgi:hypothetical protein